MIKLMTFWLLLIFTTNYALAQDATLKGRVISSENGEPLIGATVMVIGTNLGAKTNSNGMYEISGLMTGDFQVKASYVGYFQQVLNVNIAAGKAITLNFELNQGTVSSKAIQVVASLAEARETPIAFSNINKIELNRKLGSRDIPLILNETPGVYATEQGGGAGDARVNIRGFNQRNISVMINGVPVNDMENGWVYWSNWDGLSDVTSSVQVQRGLGAGKIANPSVGGTMNIVTDAANQKAGIRFKQELASANFLKSSLIANTGLMDGFAATVMATRKVGDGLIDKTYTDAWAYYMALSFDASDDHQFDFFVIGAPQAHGQRVFQQPMAYWDKQFALDNGVPKETVDKANERGTTFNQHWGNLDNPTKNYYLGSERDVRDNTFLSERENYYHKPQMNLNWFWKISETMSLTNVFYLSLGNGGGTGPLGPSFPSDAATGLINFEAAYARNDTNISSAWSTTENRSVSILRNSVNNHFWTGWLGTLNFKPIEKLTIETGLDARYYKGEHYREIRNLVGGDYYVHTLRNAKGTFVDTTGDLNEVGDKSKWVKRLGDKIDYNNDGYVQWLGGFVQGEYKMDDMTTYLNFSLSNTGYKRKDYFRTPTSPNGNETDWQNFMGFTVKAGANYNLNSNLNVFGNVGYYSRAPIFDNVFTFSNALYDNPQNEKIIAFELGTGYFERNFRANLNLYFTNWKDRAWSKSSRDTNNVEYTYNLTGLDALHMGVELDGFYKPIKYFRINYMASFGNWKWTEDVTAVYSPDDNPNQIFTTKVFSKDLYVGNQPQKQLSLGITGYPTDWSWINFTYNYYMDHYSDFDPSTRSIETDRAQPWKAPDYGTLEAHAGLTLPFNLPIDISIKGHIFNMLDSKYIIDATDNRTGRKDPNGIPYHDAERAEVYFGLPLRWVASIEFNYNFGK